MTNENQYSEERVNKGKTLVAYWLGNAKLKEADENGLALSLATVEGRTDPAQVKVYKTLKAMPSGVESLYYEVVMRDLDEEGEPVLYTYCAFWTDGESYIRDGNSFQFKAQYNDSELAARAKARNSLEKESKKLELDSEEMELYFHRYYDGIDSEFFYEEIGRHKFQDTPIDYLDL